MMFPISSSIETTVASSRCGDEAPKFRTGCRFALNQWGTALLCDDISHWLGANLESALIICSMHIDNTLVGCNEKYQNLHIQIKTGSSYLLTNKAARILQNPLYCIYHNVSHLYPPLRQHVEYRICNSILSVTHRIHFFGRLLVWMKHWKLLLVNGQVIVIVLASDLLYHCI